MASVCRRMSPPRGRGAHTRGWTTCSSNSRCLTRTSARRLRPSRAMPDYTKPRSACRIGTACSSSSSTTNAKGTCRCPQASGCLLTRIAPQTDPPVQRHSRAHRTTTARRIPALPKRGLALLRGRHKHKHRVCDLQRFMARGRGRGKEKDEGWEKRINWDRSVLHGSRVVFYLFHEVLGACYASRGPATSRTVSDPRGPVDQRPTCRPIPQKA